MKLNKIFSAVAATAVAVSAMSVAAYAEPIQDQFIIGFGDADWKASFWGKDGDVLDSSYETPAAYTGDGTYTVTLDLSKGYTNEEFVDEDTGDLLQLTTGNSIGAIGIQIYGDADEYANLGVNITNVKFDGFEYAITGASYTNDEDGGRRTNVYNGWASYDATKADHVSLDPDNATATVIDIADIGEWTTCEITFEAYTVGSAEEEELSEEKVAEDEAAEEAAAEEEAYEEAAAEELAEAAAEEIEEPVDITTVEDGDVEAATDSSKGSPDTGVADVAVVAGLAIVAAGAVVVSKKRK